MKQEPFKDLVKRMGVEEFKDLLLCCGNIYLWKLDSGGNLLQSNCPDEAVLGTAFELLGCKQRIVDYGSSHSRPISLRTVPGLVWYAAFERENGALKFIYAVGPVFYNDISAAAIESGIRGISKGKISAEWNTHFRNAIRNIPLTQCTVMMLLVLMLHYCITGERLQICDIDAEINIPIPEISRKQPSHDRYQVWSAEQALLQAVRNGDLDYKQALSDVMRLSTGVNVNGKSALAKSKISIIVFVSIVCRAAVEGGLSPEEAYGLGDSYIQMVESIENPSDLEPLAMSMYDDFVRRVHNNRTNPKYSREIQKCCDYIEMHLGQRLTAEVLAERTGYAMYYLTKKFKEETGFTVRNYAKYARMERAKILLSSTKLSVEDISAQLGFGSRSHFSREFHDIVGSTPIAYRKRNTNE
ncbi:MAG: helix-turn-helix domain-containing protein [Oscillospiraceae bacterium]|nr:helix-turn-helix domain-containing protein [Oscillospiraceae bacterium]